ncbi:MAG: hypothetical protein QMD53_01420 [Actinomycetota bacterium]|nr:hypothetical protein [Actinomycetota bacterium]
MGSFLNFSNGGAIRFMKRAAVRTFIFMMAALFLTTGLAWAGDPSGAVTGGVADVMAVNVGSPTLLGVAQDLGHLLDN